MIPVHSHEPPIVIEHRDALIFLLNEAAELEHAIMCQYLFAAFSMKKSVDEGLTEQQVQQVLRWHKIVMSVATEEMLHMAQVNNLLLAVGAAPRVGRPNLPHSGRHYPPAVQLALVPFGEQAVRHFLFLERPEGITLQDAEGFEIPDEALPLTTDQDIAPHVQDFSTVGHLYRSIEAGIRHLCARHGEEWLFIGPPSAQASPELFRWPDLVEVTDLASALKAIDIIVEQGEGPRGHWRDAHYGRFLEILGELLTLKKADPLFQPARPVVPLFVRRPSDTDGPLVSDPTTARVLDSFNVTYEILLHTLSRFFGHGEETADQVGFLADLAVLLMIQVLKPLGELATRLPAGPDHPGMTAGPSFELFHASGYLLPHARPAWVLIHERLHELSAFMKATVNRAGYPEELVDIARSVDRLAAQMTDHMQDLDARKVEAPLAWLGRGSASD